MATKVTTGDKAPDFELQDPDGVSVRLSDLRGKSLVLYFYPKSFTGGCTAQACGLRDAYSTFQSEGIEVVGVSVDDVETQRRFRDEYALPFPVLADPGGTVAQKYGVYGITKKDGTVLNEARRVTFIIDGNGVIRGVIDPAHADVHVAEVLDVMKA
jgi:peroxiredoxin Q/BCP